MVRPEIDHVDTPPMCGVVCGWCGVYDMPLSVCAGCRLVTYCGRDCQKKHRKVHAPFCKASSRGGHSLPRGPVRGARAWSALCELHAVACGADPRSSLGAAIVSAVGLRRRCTVCNCTFDDDNTAAKGANPPSAPSLTTCDKCGVSARCAGCDSEWTKTVHTDAACEDASLCADYARLAAQFHEHPAVVFENRTGGIDLDAVARKVFGGGDFGGRGGGGGGGGGDDDDDDNGDDESGDAAAAAAAGARPLNPRPNMRLWGAYFEARAAPEEARDSRGEQLRIIASVRLSAALTPVYAAQLGWCGPEASAALAASSEAGGGAPEEFIMHVVGASMQFEAGQNSMWEELHHVCPSLRRLSVVLVSPSIVDVEQTDDERGDDTGEDAVAPGFDNMMCPECTDTRGVALHIELHRREYHEYASGRKFRKPHLVLGCDAGIAGTKDMWRRNLDAVVQTGAPAVFTASTAPRAAALAAQVSAAFGSSRTRHGPSINPYRAAPPVPILSASTVTRCDDNENDDDDDDGDDDPPAELFAVRNAYVVAVEGRGDV